LLFVGLVGTAMLIGAAAALASTSTHARSAAAAATPKRGGSVTIDRIEDSQSFDKTNVFQNESIWIDEQIMETLYTTASNGKTLIPWLATGYTASKDGKRYTFTLR
jgi:peptide/nickel transport system substrate-binding protein